MNIFGIGLPEMALILVLALLVFGPKKLPEIGRSLGEAIRGFQKASKEFEDEFKKEAEQIQKGVTEPMKASLEKPEPRALSSQPAATVAPAEAKEEALEAELIEDEKAAENSQTA
ncbi:TatA/E family twin arginine-targeting protein translocase [Pseudanabaena sp. FACHB-2040]|uniref:TatA/E family twin arginine-targeting protein translocase n=1 Tax=Pseudanabaena sp. FACHB-2040 TaxID=2692859 RepID=UPI0016843DF4|nr:TatA/E family twin arginine-targeting protein translocase [Pseudanabaena sp. FACHB-2040]MBD2260752.1 TatA/E family twin arginine-targeting protein translocase [Pseudanabaena sp. FACHB-2040]